MEKKEDLEWKKTTDRTYSSQTALVLLALQPEVGSGSLMEPDGPNIT
jgi:hypothetical protein